LITIAANSEFIINFIETRYMRRAWSILSAAYRNTRRGYDMENTKLLIRPRLVKDALSSVLVTAGFAILPETDQYADGVVVIIDFDDYKNPDALLAHQQNGSKIVVLANELDCRGLEHDQIAALSGILTYDLSAEPFVRSLRLICSGERVFPREPTMRSKPRIPSRETSPRRSDVDRLSPREREILSHLTEGHSNKGIARILGITEATVKVHLKSLLRKISVDNRTQAAIWALSNLPAPGSRASMLAA
jgi:two-component system nitrate/nitrite response regulator NarL